MNHTYRHTQFGTVILAGLAAAVLLAFATIGAVGVPLVAVRTSLFLAGLVAVLFPTLTTEVDRERVCCFFGLGFIRRTIAMREIEQATVVRNSWINGWGIRLIPDGWLWNVSGYDAVELKLRGGRRFRIGTDEPTELLSAIQAHVPAP
jgi:hypothetical protein